MSKKKLYLHDAEMLYLQGCTLEEIAEVVPVSVNSLSAWSQEHGWPEKRKQKNRHPLAMAEKIDILLEKLVDEIVAADGKVTSEQSDSISKLSAVRKNLAGTVDYGRQVIKVTDDLARYARNRIKDEGEMSRFADILSGFYQETKEKNYG